MIEETTRGAPSFAIEVDRHEDAQSFVLRGDFVDGSADLFREQLKKAQSRQGGSLIIDLRGLDSIDADGFGALLGAWNLTRQDGVEIILVRVSKHMRPLIEQSGIDRVLPVAYDGGRFDRS